MTVNDLTWNPHPIHHGEQAIVSFPNGYGASILRNGEPFTYTKNGTYELAVLRHNELCYDTPVASDVLGYLTAAEVETALAQIMKQKTKTQIEEIRTQQSISRWITQLEFIHANRTALEHLDLPFSIFGQYCDFDNLERPALLAVIKTFPGRWDKAPTYDSSGITYTLAEPVSGLTIRCYNGEAPPSCKIEETVEYVEVPARTERKVTRKIVCPEAA